MARSRRVELRALERAVRLCLVEDAVYWAVSLSDNFTRQQEVLWQLMESALEDAVQPDLAGTASLLLSDLSFRRKDVGELAYELARAPKLWQLGNGRELIWFMHSSGRMPDDGSRLEDVVRYLELGAREPAAGRRRGATVMDYRPGAGA